MKVYAGRGNYHSTLFVCARVARAVSVTQFSPATPGPENMFRCSLTVQGHTEFIKMNPFFVYVSWTLVYSIRRCDDLTFLLPVHCVIFSYRMKHRINKTGSHNIIVKSLCLILLLTLGFYQCQSPVYRIPVDITSNTLLGNSYLAQAV